MATSMHFPKAEKQNQRIPRTLENHETVNKVIVMATNHLLTSFLR